MRIHKQHFVVGSLGILACAALVGGTFPEARLTQLPDAGHAAARDDSRDVDAAVELHRESHFERAARSFAPNEVRQEQQERIQEVEVTQKKEHDSVVAERCKDLEGARLAKCIFKTTGWNK